jgi:hypothetical protein
MRKVKKEARHTVSMIQDERGTLDQSTPLISAPKVSRVGVTVRPLRTYEDILMGARPEWGMNTNGCL